MNNSDYFPQYHLVLLGLLLPGCILMYLRASQNYIDNLFQRSMFVFQSDTSLQ